MEYFMGHKKCEAVINHFAFNLCTIISLSTFLTPRQSHTSAARRYYFHLFFLRNKKYCIFAID